LRYLIKNIYYLLNFYLYKIKYKNVKFYFISIIKNTKFTKHIVISSNCEIINSEIDDFTYVSSNTKIINSKIGKFCSIASGVKINLPMHPVTNNISTHPFFYSDKYEKFNKIKSTKFIEFSKVDIGNDVWIGENVIILSGIKIGNGAILAAGAVVTKDIPNYAVAAGIPAKIIKMRFDTSEIQILQNAQWWNTEPIDLIKNIDIFNNKQLYFDRNR
jgi:acetyltransferase-like isoleucine patch superfamily enzyme